MLRLTAFEFLVRTIPESLVYIFAGYAFSNEKLNVNRYLISSLLLAVSTFIIRMLPINYGVHTILFIIIQTTILASINKIDVIQSVKSAIIAVIFLLIFEGINMLILNLTFKDELESIMLNPISKIIYGFPSLGGFAIIVLCYYYLRKKAKYKYDEN